jgi:uncharacterized membrane protein
VSKGKSPSTLPSNKSHILHASYSGPLPPPTILDGYESLMSGAAELIFKTYENEVAHRQATEKEMLRIEAAASKSSSSIMIMGQVFGFIICMAFLASGTYLIANGHEISGALFGGGSMAAIVTAFLATRTK